MTIALAIFAVELLAYGILSPQKLVSYVPSVMADSGLRVAVVARLLLVFCYSSLTH